mgnify:CR=1 FL=1
MLEKTRYHASANCGRSCMFLRAPALDPSALPRSPQVDQPVPLATLTSPAVPHTTDPNVSLVYAVPHGLALTTFHRVLLQPYSRYGVTSLAEIGRLDRQVCGEGHVKAAACVRMCVKCTTGKLRAGQCMCVYVSVGVLESGTRRETRSSTCVFAYDMCL